jgi:1-acyl-sn-glycerol-3-phosphate acyltransferase
MTLHPSARYAERSAIQNTAHAKKREVQTLPSKEQIMTLQAQVKKANQMADVWFSEQLPVALEAASQRASRWLGEQLPTALDTAGEIAGRWLTDPFPIALERGLNGLGRSTIGLYARLALRTDIQWHAPLPAGPKIIAANHPTTTDPFYILMLVRQQTSVLVTESAFRVPVFGRYLLGAGHVAAVCDSRGATVQALRQQIEAGRNVAIFPEGALSPLAGGFHRPHTGVARVALLTGAPVVPVGIGLQREQIRVVRTKIDGGEEVAHLYLRGPYAMTVGKPMSFEESLEDRGYVCWVAQQIMQRIIHLAGESEGRVRQASVSTPSNASLSATCSAG